MKKVWKRTLAMLLVVIMVGGAAPIGALANMDWPTLPDGAVASWVNDGVSAIKTAAKQLGDKLQGLSLRASAETYSGSCGDNVTWSLNTGTGKLTISGTGEMYNNYTLAPWYGYRTSIRTVTIGSSVTSIGGGAFEDCTSLASVTIPNSVTSIGDSAFELCTSLANVTIPNSVTEIGDYAFHGCESLSSVTIPNSVTSIGDFAFFGCTSLASITIPGSVTEIGGYTFFGCTSLASVTIPNSVTSIGDSAFIFCESLTSVTIPNSVKTIGSQAFSGCTSLVSVTIGNSVTYLGDYAFYCCTSLQSVIIPDSVKQIGRAFANCTSLSHVTFNAVNCTNIAYWDSIFEECTALKTVIFGNSVEVIPTYAFFECKNLNNVTIGNRVTTIGEWAFGKCTGLTSITIPGSVSKLGDGAFDYCYNLTDVTFGEGITEIGGTSAFGNCYSLSSVTIPNSVTSIGVGAFACCVSLASVTIPDSVKRIGVGAFYLHLDDFNLDDIIELQAAYDAALLAGETQIGDLPLSAVKNILDHPNGSLTDVYYTGSEAQWNKIAFGEDNDDLLNARIHFNSSGGDIDPEHPLQTEGLKIMSYNVYVKDDTVKGKENGITYDCHYSTRLKHVEANIMNNLPDSIGLQEVSKDIKTIFENYPDINGKSMKNTYAFVGEFRDKDKLLASGANNEASLIAYRKDKYTLIESGTRWLSEEGKKYSKHSKAEYIRIFTYALLENKTTKQQYLHINTHIDHNDVAAEFAAGQIIYFVNHSYPNTPVVLTGDLNHTNSSQMYKNLLSAGFADTNVNNNTTVTYTNCYNQGEKKDGEMQIYDPKVIDFIFVRNGLEKGIKSYSVYAEDYTNTAKYGSNALPYPYASDHHPIVSTLSLQYRDTAITKDTVYTTEKGHTSTNKVKYDSKWLGFDNKNYNHELAQFCADFAMLGYTGITTKEGDSAELKQNLKEFGFANAEINLKTGQKEEGRDRINYFIADKKEIVNGEEYTVVFAGFIGSNGYQWYSNFDPYGTERQQSYAGNSEKDKIHLGFADARDFAIGLLQAHINKLGVDRSKIKLILTGHSRGAATANLIAAKIIDGKAPLAYSDNLYTYTFATPNVAQRNAANVSAEKYKCIFNIVNPEDFVTKVLLHDWGYGRYGVTYTLPSKDNDSNYKKYKSKMNKLFQRYFGDEYEPYANGEKATYKIVKKLGENVKDLYEFYNKDFYFYAFTYEKPFDFFKMTLLPYVSHTDKFGAIVNVINVATEFSDLYKSILLYFLKTDWLDSYGNLDPQIAGDFEHAHQVETYCAYMNALTSSQLTEYRAAYKESFNCPVDVEVYDTDTDELVGRIANNTVDETVAAKENAVVADVDGDSKEFWLPSNGNYRVVVTGNDTGTMDCSFAQIDPDVGEVNRENFFDVAVQDGVSMTADFSEEFDGLDALTLSMADGTELRPTESVEEKAKEYRINVTVDGLGYANESSTAVSGDYVSLSAAAQEGANFLGWYENGTLVSDAPELSFVAKADRDLTAKFEANAYTVTWIVDGEKTTESVDFGQPIQKPADPVKEGYTFTGWSPEVPATMPAEDQTFTAVFELSRYTATLVADGAVVQTVEYAYGQKSIPLPDVPKKEGYTGVWPSYTLLAGGVTITAIYTANTYTVMWITDGKTTTESVDFGQPIQKPADPVKEGYTFTGWSPEVPATMPAKDMTFTAQFTSNTKPVATKLNIVKKPSKTTYTYRNDTSVSLSGLELEVVYSDGTKKTVTDTSGCKVSGYSAKPVGSKTVTVEYEGVKASFNVTVQYAGWQWIILILLFGFLWY